MSSILQVLSRQEDDYIILPDCEIMWQRVYLFPLAATVCFGIKPQHLRSHRESTHGQIPPQFSVAMVKTFENTRDLQQLYTGLSAAAAAAAAAVIQPPPPLQLLTTWALGRRPAATVI